MPGAGGLSAVLDIGKTNRTLILFDGRGEQVLSRSSASSVVESGLGYSCLDTAETEAWLKSALSGLGSLRSSLRRIIVTTHGAAFAALHGDSLHFPVPDYEWEGFEPSAQTLRECENFPETLSPVLPRGLNLGSQFDWLERHHPQLMASAETFVPYPQYWSWWLSGVAASEVSSLGCHTLLWDPHAQSFSRWAQARGWAQRFARMRRAWEVIGTLRPALSKELGLPLAVEVHAGVHDSNACLARYLRNWPHMTLVSTGTWVVVMTPGSPARGLDPALDQLGNVSVRGDCVPTARFMGGREIGVLCAGADPALASVAEAERLLQRGLHILPAFETQGGPYASMKGEIRLDGQIYTLADWSHAPPAQRATAAAIYAAFVTAKLIQGLGGLGPIVVDGPFADNPVVMELLAALLPRQEVYASDDEIEGTMRGGWSLTRWTEPVVHSPQVRLERSRESLARLVKTDWERFPTSASGRH